MDSESGEELLVVISNSVSCKEISRYRIIEEKLFDRSVSEVLTRVLFIAPLKEARSSDGIVRGYEPLFYIYFPHARKLLSKELVGLRQHENDSLSFDDVFSQRLFQSYVTKGSNVYNRPISSQSSGIDGIIESGGKDLRMLNFQLDLHDY